MITVCLVFLSRSKLLLLLTNSSLLWQKKTKKHIHSHQPVNQTRRSCVHTWLSGSRVTAKQAVRVEFGPALFWGLVLFFIVSDNWSRSLELEPYPVYGYAYLIRKLTLCLLQSGKKDSFVFIWDYYRLILACAPASHDIQYKTMCSYPAWNCHYDSQVFKTLSKTHWDRRCLNSSVCCSHRLWVCTSLKIKFHCVQFVIEACQEFVISLKTMWVCQYNIA